MRTKIRIFMWGIVCFSVVALVEQLTPAKFYCSRLISTTSVQDKANARTGDLVFTLRVTKPITRWIPLVKYGETVYFHHYLRSADPNALVERDATTRTRLLVIGLCSTELYDHLASGPYELVHSDYLKY